MYQTYVGPPQQPPRRAGVTGRPLHARPTDPMFRRSTHRLVRAASSLTVGSAGPNCLVSPASPAAAPSRSIGSNAGDQSGLHQRFLPPLLSWTFGYSRHSTQLSGTGRGSTASMATSRTVACASGVTGWHSACMTPSTNVFARTSVMCQAGPSATGMRPRRSDMRPNRLSLLCLRGSTPSCTALPAAAVACYTSTVFTQPRGPLSSGFSPARHHSRSQAVCPSPSPTLGSSISSACWASSRVVVPQAPGWGPSQRTASQGSPGLVATSAGPAAAASAPARNEREVRPRDVASPDPTDLNSARRVGGSDSDGGGMGHGQAPAAGSDGRGPVSGGRDPEDLLRGLGDDVSSRRRSVTVDGDSGSGSLTPCCCSSLSPSPPLSSGGGSSRTLGTQRSADETSSADADFSLSSTSAGSGLLSGTSVSSSMVGRPASFRSAVHDDNSSASSDGELPHTELQARSRGVVPRALGGAVADQPHENGAGAAVLPDSPEAASGAAAAAEGSGTGWRRYRGVAPGRVQIWWTALDKDSACSPTRVARCASCLPPAEAAEMAGSKTADVAAKRTTARALARCVLARAVSAPGGGDGGGQGVLGGVDESGGGSGGICRAEGGEAVVLPQDLVFRRNAHGKPRLLARAGWADLRHNLTHTHDLAGIAMYHPPLSTPANGTCTTSGAAGAVRMRYSVGLDVERLDRAPRDPMALARRRLAAAEVRDLEALTGEDRARHFMWLWTLKEAYVKARGTGINAPPGLKGFAIGFEDMPPSRLQRLASTCHAASAYRLHPAIKTITLQHTAPGPAPARATSASTAPATLAASTSTPTWRQPAAAAAAAATGAEPRAQQPQSASTAAATKDDDAEVPFDGHAATDFTFMLFQPTPRHVGALCLAAHPGVAAGAASPAEKAGSGLPAATGPAGAAWAAGSLAARTPLRGGLVPGPGSGWGPVWDERQQPGATLGPAGDLLFVAGQQQQQQLEEEEDAVAGLLPGLVEQWWCLPLESEWRMSGGEVTLLGVS